VSLLRQELPVGGGKGHVYNLKVYGQEGGPRKPGGRCWGEWTNWGGIVIYRKKRGKRQPCPVKTTGKKGFGGGKSREVRELGSISGGNGMGRVGRGRPC